MIKDFEHLSQESFEKISKIKGVQKILYVCDNEKCKKEFLREWKNIRIHFNRNLCNDCRSQETRIKQSNSAIKRFKDPNERLKLSRGVKKRFEDPNEGLKISITKKEKAKDPEFKRKASKTALLLWQRKEFREKRLKIIKEYCSQPKVREKFSKFQKHLWNNEDYRQRMIPIVTKNRLYKEEMNKEEKIVFEIVKNFGFEFCGNGRNVKQIAGFCPDFINENKKLIIEFNGCYWHRCKKCFPRRFEGKTFTSRDLAKLHAYPRMGYRVLFLWEHDLINDTIKQKISEFVNNPNYKSKIMDDTID